MVFYSLIVCTYFILYNLQPKANYYFGEFATKNLNTCSKCLGVFDFAPIHIHPHKNERLVVSHPKGSDSIQQQNIIKRNSFNT